MLIGAYNLETSFADSFLPPVVQLKRSIFDDPACSLPFGSCAAGLTTVSELVSNDHKAHAISKDDEDSPPSNGEDSSMCDGLFVRFGEDKG